MILKRHSLSGSKDNFYLIYHLHISTTILGFQFTNHQVRLYEIKKSVCIVNSLCTARNLGRKCNFKWEEANLCNIGNYSFHFIHLDEIKGYRNDELDPENSDEI